MTIVQFCSFKWIFLKASFNSKPLIQTPITRQRCTNTWPANGREERSVVINHCFTDDVKKKSGLRFIGSGRFEGKDWNGVPTPFSRPPSPAEVLFRVTDYDGPDLARTVNYERWRWVFEKSRLLRRSSFDKRWLKYTVRMEDCTYLCFLDDYRVCVKKKEFLQTPSAAPDVT